MQPSEREKRPARHTKNLLRNIRLRLLRKLQRPGSRNSVPQQSRPQYRSQQSRACLALLVVVLIQQGTACQQKTVAGRRLVIYCASFFASGPFSFLAAALAFSFRLLSLTSLRCLFITFFLFDRAIFLLVNTGKRYFSLSVFNYQSCEIKSSELGTPALQNLL